MGTCGLQYLLGPKRALYRKSEPGRGKEPGDLAVALPPI